MSDGDEAYRSYVRITIGGNTPECDWPHPGPVTDSTDATLRELRRRVVEPVVAGLLEPGELEDLAVCWGEAGDPGDIWVRLVAVGEDYAAILTSPTWGVAQLHETEALTERLAGQLEDWVCETRFGWGEQRRARYVCPSDPPLNPPPGIPARGE